MNVYIIQQYVHICAVLYIHSPIDNLFSKCAARAFSGDPNKLMGSSDKSPKLHIVKQT